MTTEILLWILRIVFGGLFIMAGANKFISGAGEDAFMLQIYALIGEDAMRAAAMCELGGGISLLVPALSFYASLLLVVIMVIASGIAFMLGGLTKATFPLIVLCFMIGLVIINPKPSYDEE